MLWIHSLSRSNRNPSALAYNSLSRLGYIRDVRFCIRKSHHYQNHHCLCYHRECVPRHLQSTETEHARIWCNMTWFLAPDWEASPDIIWLMRPWQGASSWWVSAYLWWLLSVWKIWIPSSGLCTNLILQLPPDAYASKRKVNYNNLPVVNPSQYIGLERLFFFSQQEVLQSTMFTNCSFFFLFHTKRRAPPLFIRG
jgi:hypothetical protein